ncbi:MAG: hypothetical protein ACLS5G_00415 [Streptococcus sp.]
MVANLTDGTTTESPLKAPFKEIVQEDDSLERDFKVVKKAKKVK